jgi:hypothetical protein
MYINRQNTNNIILTGGNVEENAEENSNHSRTNSITESIFEVATELTIPESPTQNVNILEEVTISRSISSRTSAENLADINNEQIQLSQINTTHRIFRINRITISGANQRQHIRFNETTTSYPAPTNYDNNDIQLEPLNIIDETLVNSELSAISNQEAIERINRIENNLRRIISRRRHESPIRTRNNISSNVSSNSSANNSTINLENNLLINSDQVSIQRPQNPAPPETSVSEDDIIRPDTPYPIPPELFYETPNTYRRRRRLRRAVE